MTNERLQRLGPVAVLMFTAAVVTVFFPSAVGIVVALAALFVVGGVAAAADRIAEVRS